MTREELVRNLDEACQTVQQVVAHTPEAALNAPQPSGAWTAGQHTHHLTLSVKPLGMAFGLPGWVLRMLFGKPKAPSRTYEAVVAEYTLHLARGAKAAEAYIPPAAAPPRDVLLLHFEIQHQRLIAKLGKWSDPALDNHQLPHPILGKITMREMLYFTHYHILHHSNRITEMLKTI